MAFRSNIQTFLKETNAAIKKEQSKADSEAKKIVLESYRSIVQLSPVDTGLFRASNIISFNVPNDTVPTKVDNTRIARATIAVGGFKLQNGNKIYIQNNLKYAEPLEVGRSIQAPAGIYGVTEARIRRLLAKRINI